MQAVGLSEFGGPEKLELQTLPVPAIESDEVLVRLEVAGVGEWDAFEREGGYADALGREPQFPYVLGSEGAGVVAAVGSGVSRVKPGDRVYALGFLNPKGGFYAEYVALPQGGVSPVPVQLSMEQAGVMSGVATTALRGLDDTLKLRSRETLLIFGASGGVGHTAVQLAKRMGARVFAVASEDDGVALAVRMGADAAVNGHGHGVLEAARAFAPAGLDAALIVGSGDISRELLRAVRAGGRVAYPNGVQPVPEARSGVLVTAYNGEPDEDIVRRLNALIDAGPFSVHVARSFPLREARQAHEALRQHYLGKLALRIGPAGTRQGPTDRSPPAPARTRTRATSTSTKATTSTRRSSRAG